MISALRHVFVDSWLGRILALLIFFAFIGWGVGDIFGNLGGSDANTVVKIGDRRITAEDLDRGIRSELPQVAKQMGVTDPSQLPPSARRQAAQSVLQRLVSQNEILALAARNGMQVPDSLVREEVFALPYFHGTDGKFDRKLFDQRMAQAGMSEKQLLQMVRDDITVRSLIEGLGDTMQVPSSLLQRLLDYDAQEHVLDIVRVNAGTMTPPAAPTEGQIHRYYDNHPWNYRTTEFRHAKIVVLSAEGVAKSIVIPEADLKRFYEFQSQRYHVPETRSLEVLTFQDQAAANKIAESWKGGASWEVIQAQASNAAAVSFPDTRASDVPSPELAKAAFAAPVNAIQGPLKTETGWVVFRVKDIKPPHNVDFDHAKDDLRDEITRAQAPQLLQSRLPRFQDAVAGSTDLEHIPTDLGAIPAQGSLDAQGMTKDGEPAPLPGDPELRQAIIARIFSQAEGVKPSVVNGPKGGAFAVLVDHIEPGALKSFDSVRDQVVHDWTEAQRRHAADERATTIFDKAKQQGGVAKAVAGTTDASSMQSGMAVSRIKPVPLPQPLLPLIFGTPVGQSAMLNVNDDYFVVTVTGLRDGDPATMKELSSRLRPQLEESLRGDIPTTVVHSLEDKLKPVPNVQLMQRVIDASGGGAGQ
ncbi:peptidylprolyl isomerase [Kozakia baliensis]|uniref:peptidylprolyl isomerase n=1 Tax=Kozakia baliensis TaxID=153496 RepID=UPI00087B8444|nr:peptidylprolyl isomerase [Kozakia baliensis]AOX19839.1 peptidylprolyl isomerase [Kozakia baliensis]